MAKRPRKQARHSPLVSPTCSCLVLCDDVVVRHGHDKHELIGIIGSIVVPFVPSLVNGGVVYARVSNVHNIQKLTVSFVHADDDHEPLWRIDAEIVNRNEPLDVHTLMARVPPFPIEKAGRYLLEAKYNGVSIASAPIKVSSLNLNPPPGWSNTGGMPGGGNT